MVGIVAVLDAGGVIIIGIDAVDLEGIIGGLIGGQLHLVQKLLRLLNCLLHLRPNQQFPVLQDVPIVIEVSCSVYPVGLVGRSGLCLLPGSQLLPFAGNNSSGNNYREPEIFSPARPANERYCCYNTAQAEKK